MILLMAAALAAQGHWTGPHTVEYRGPGYFCGGGYAIHLLRGDRALILPQDTGGQGARLVLAGHEVNVHSGVRPAGGRLVAHYQDSVVTEQSGPAAFAYSVSDQTDFALSLTSDAFRGFKRDGWFFTRANFNASAEHSVECLAAESY